MEPVRSSMTESLDQVFLYITAVSALLLVLVTVLMIWFAIRYHRSRHPVAEEVRGNLSLEILWTAIPLVLVLSMFYFSYEQFRELRNVPAGAMTVTVTGRMWDWSFDYENGKKSTELYVPLDQPVKLILKSVDVNHSFYIPAFRVKEDAIPGQENFLWFKPATMGPADIFCAEFCGQRHAYMISKVHVLSPDEFRKWYGEPAGATPAGEPPVMNVLKKHDCLTCHSLDGTEGLGPSLKGLRGSSRTVVAGGQEKTVIADDEYLRRAILNPAAERVRGSQGEMPVPENLPEEELKLILEYLKNLK